MRILLAATFIYCTSILHAQSSDTPNSIVFECLNKYGAPSNEPCKKRRKIMAIFMDGNSNIGETRYFAKPKVLANNGLAYDTSSAEILKSEFTGKEICTYRSDGKRLTRKQFTCGELESCQMTRSDSLVYSNGKLLLNFTYHHGLLDTIAYETTRLADTVVVQSDIHPSGSASTDSVWYNSDAQIYRTIRYLDGRLAQTQTTTWPSARKRETITNSRDGSVLNSEITVQNDEGNDILMLRTHSSGLVWEHKWEYDSSGRVKKSITKSGDAIQQYWMYEYLD